MSARTLRPAEQTAVARFSTIVAEAYGIAQELDPEQAIAAIAELERVRVKLWQKLSVPTTTPEPADRNLTAAQAAERLAIPVSALYRRKDWPFRVSVSRGRTRYSSAGIDRFIRSRLGR